jgi:Phasin protein
MSNPSSGRRPSDRRPARRSLVELTALASRAVRDDLPVESAGSVAAVIDRAHAAEATAEVHVGEPEGANGELHTSDSTAELAVKIAKEFQARALEDFRLSMNAALNYGKDLVEARGVSGGASKEHPRPKDQILTSLGAAAQYRAESLELVKANVETALDYTRALVDARTPAEFVELSSEHARKQCELILKQTSALKSFARAATTSDTD